MLSLEVILLLFLLFNVFITKIFVFMNINYVVLWIIPLVVLLLMVGLQKERHLYKTDVFQIVFIFTVMFQVLSYVLGLFLGFNASPYSMEFVKILQNVVLASIIIISQEVIRYIVISKSETKKVFIALMTVIFILFDISMAIDSNTFLDLMRGFEFIATWALPCVLNNILLTYICYKSGYKANILYRLLMDLPVYLLPIIPNLGIYLKSLSMILLPLFIFLNVNSFYANTKPNLDRRNKFKGYLFWIPVGTVFAGMIILISGVFKVYSIAIGSGSMTPAINKGDAIVIEKLKESEMENLKVGDVIVYEQNNRIIVHRVTERTYESGRLIFKTKGDNNKEEDNYIVEMRNIKGKVQFKIPFVAYPSVWLSETLNK